MAIASINDHEDVVAADHMPISAVAVPVAIPVCMPVRVVPIAIRVDNGRTAPADSPIVINPVGSTRMIGPIGASDGRTAVSVDGRAVAGLDCCAMLVMGDFAVFPLVGVGEKSGAR